MSKSIDKDKEYMYKMWGTSHLTSEYGIFEKIKEQKMLREINCDDETPKKHNFHVQKEIHQKIRNDNDYDDWEYGTEPIFG